MGWLKKLINNINSVIRVLSKALGFLLNIKVNIPEKPMRKAAIVSLLWIANPLLTAGHLLFKHRDDPLTVRP
jgi:hypothetical protein